MKDIGQIRKIDKFIKNKIKIAEIYSSLLKDIKGITLPREMPWAENMYWMYSILIEDNFRMDRDELIYMLEQNGIETRPIFYPMHILPPYKNEEIFPIAENVSKRGISLPSSVNLKEEQIEQIVHTIISG